MRATYDIDETSKILGISRNATYAAAAAKLIATIRLGRRIVVPKAALERMLADAGQKVA
jgi:hypothetical protein